MKQVKLNRATRRWIAKHKSEVKMSDEVKPVDAQTKFQEYWNECARLGDLVLTVRLLQDRLKEARSLVEDQRAKVTKLNFEVTEARKAEAANKAKEVPVEASKAE